MSCIAGAPVWNRLTPGKFSSAASIKSWLLAGSHKGSSTGKTYSSTKRQQDNK
jgi:hypothetical protein